MMMHALGASVNQPGTLACCDSCDSSKCPPNLCFESQFIGGTCRSNRRKRRTAFKDVNADHKTTLKDSLSKAVDEYMEENPSFNMLGRSFVCPDCVIDNICTQARFIKSQDDLSFVQIHPELKSRFFNVVRNVLSSAPNVKRTRHL